MATVNVCETFVSIQGESTYAGLPCFFIRLAGCNLRCKYCDTKYAYKAGRDVNVPDLVRQCKDCNVVIVEITGGEPLLQTGFAELAKALRDKTGKKVLVETNGSCNISVIPDRVAAIMDIKCPGSGESESMDVGNIRRLRPYDEVKFVLSSRSDYLWAKKFVGKHKLESYCNAVLFSPVYGKINARMLGEWIIKDQLPVRLQVQMHKVIRMT
ncbi:MAG: radical SAM protein [Kiritimatiellae bacterium]|nr:radical SAM protein [Kiritimatiellia bacterium]MDD5521391.1 radical SAM protein [Kiritimatiellia bacterium]